MQYVKWELDVALLAAAFGISKEHIVSGVPTLSAYQDMVKHRPGTRTEARAIEVQYVEYRTKWQVINTAIYWHVRPSLVIDGVHFLADA